MSGYKGIFGKLLAWDLCHRTSIHQKKKKRRRVCKHHWALLGLLSLSLQGGFEQLLVEESEIRFIDSVKRLEKHGLEILLLLKLCVLRLTEFLNTGFRFFQSPIT